MVDFGLICLNFDLVLAYVFVDLTNFPITDPAAKPAIKPKNVLIVFIL